MKKFWITAALAAACSANVAYANDASDSGFSDMEMIMLTSDYRMRGISQSGLDPALQGSVDLTNRSSGWYVGSMLSTIKWIEDMGGRDHLDWEVYGGQRGKLVGGVSYDVGALTYIYPDNDLSPNADTTEIYGKIGYGPAYVKYSDSATNLFGYMDSKNSGYLEVGADVDVGSGFTLNLHAGHQTVKNNPMFSYSDWAVGIAKYVRVVTVNMAAVGTNTNTYVGPAPEMKNLGRAGIVLTVTKMF